MGVTEQNISRQIERGSERKRGKITEREHAEKNTESKRGKREMEEAEKG